MNTTNLTINDTITAANQHRFTIIIRTPDTFNVSTGLVD